MKGIFKKNQVIITSLALMLAVAGFLQMSEDTMVGAGNASGDMAVGGTVENHYEITAGDFSELSSEISDEDMMGEALAAAENDAVKQASATAEGTVSVADGSKVMEEPGEAVLVTPPVYYPFYNVIRNNERKLVESGLLYENGKYTELDVEKIREKLFPILHRIFNA